MRVDEEGKMREKNGEGRGGGERALWSVEKGAGRGSRGEERGKGVEGRGERVEEGECGEG